MEPNEQVIRGLKAKLQYESCDLLCTPIERCDCEEMLNDIVAANNWIQSLPGESAECNE
jgi:hypothetical protein|tara:strand:- start:1226 stop:1402 length:177 start_codon:yes stop_codon:yes gene_type:complete